MDLLRIQELLLDDSFKGIPGGITPFPLSTIADKKWSLLSEDLPLPLLVLKRSELEHNISLMQKYCIEEGVLLAPHGKTTMAPQIFEMQFEAGAWAITAASVEQLHVYRRFGVPRVLFANQLVGKQNIQYVCDALSADESFDFYCFVDSVRGVELLAEAARGNQLTNPVKVLVEVGYVGGRGGVRSLDALDELYSVIERSDGVELHGVSGFEGLLPVERFAVDAQAPADDKVAPFLSSIREAVEHLLDKSALPDDYLVSAGGSAAFDKVVEILRPAGGQLVLRSGCYVTHDHGMYAGTSPLHGSHTDAARDLGSLQPALELWCYVQSRPEKDVSLLTFGRRDAPFDYGLPVPLRHHPAGQVPSQVSDDWEITSLNDQHAYLRHPANASVEVGDRLVCGISHPCTAFDKWSVIPVVDDDYTIVDAIKTYF